MDIAGQLQKLHQLHEGGALSDEEFAKAKQVVLNGTPDEVTGENDKERSSLSAYLMHKAAAPPSPQPREEAKQPRAPDALPTKQARALRYAPIAPKLAKLHPDEQHLYTFCISPFVYKKKGLAGWIPDHTRFIWHLTDRRVLVEPYARGKVEGFLMKKLIDVGASLKYGEIAMKAYKRDYEAGQQQLDKMDGEWSAIPYTEIAKVERQDLPWYQLSAKLALVVFKDPEVQPLVVAVAAADGDHFALTITGYTGDFITAMADLLGHGKEDHGKGKAGKL